MANDRNWNRTAAVEVCLPFNFAVVFDFMYFRFRPSKAKSIGSVLMNRQKATKSDPCFFFSFIMRTAYWRIESFCVIRQCAANRKKIPGIKFRYQCRSKFKPRRLLTQSASLSIYWRRKNLFSLHRKTQIFKTGANNLLRFAMGPSPKNCGLLAETEIHWN